MAAAHLLLDALFDHISIPISYVTGDLTYRYCSAEAARLLGKSVSQVVGHSLREVGPHNPTVLQAIEDVLAGGEPPKQVIRFVATELGERIYRASYSPVCDAQGNVVGCLVEGEDLTERRKAEEALEAYDKTHLTLLHEMNHRVKNNLSVILGLIYAEKRHISQEDSPRSEAILDDLSCRVRSMAAAYTMLSASRWQPLALSGLAEEVIDAAVSTAPGLKEVVVEVSPSQVHILPEQAHHLALVLGELATNTVKHGCHEEALRVKVDTFLEDGQVHLVYTDAGPGYPPQVLAGTYSVGLELLNTIVTLSLRGTWAIHNDGGAVTDLCFPASLEETGA